MFKDLLDKGKSFVMDNAKKIKDKKAEHDEATNKFNELISKNNKLEVTTPICKNNPDAQEFNTSKILNMASSSINNERALVLASLIPIVETILDVKYLKEETTGKYYYFILTNSYIYITDLALYKKMEYTDITKCEFVVKNVLSQGININDIAFTIEGVGDEGTVFTNILFDAEYRLKKIQENTSYLMNVIPSIQLINKYNAGVTIDSNRNLVLHNNKENIIIKLDDVEYCKLLVDTTVVYFKGTSSTPLTTTKPTGYEMSISFITKDKTYNITILPRSSLNKMVTSQDKAYIEAYEFGKRLINKVINLKMGVE